jgi:hypothetical protein
VILSCSGFWFKQSSARPALVVLNIDLLAAFAGDVDLQGGCIPRQSSDSASGQRFYRAVLLL